MQPRGVGNQLPAPATPRVRAEARLQAGGEPSGRHVVAAALLARLAPPALRDAARITGQDRVQDDSGSFGSSGSSSRVSPTISCPGTNGIDVIGDR